MSVIVQRHGDVGMAHDVLQVFGFIPAWASRVQKVCRIVWGVMFGRASSGLWCLLYFLTSPWNMLS